MRGWPLLLLLHPAAAVLSCVHSRVMHKGFGAFSSRTVVQRSAASLLRIGRGLRAGLDAKWGGAELSFPHILHDNAGVAVSGTPPRGEALLPCPKVRRLGLLRKFLGGSDDARLVEANCCRVDYVYANWHYYHKEVEVRGCGFCEGCPEAEAELSASPPSGHFALLHAPRLLDKKADPGKTLTKKSECFRKSLGYPPYFTRFTDEDLAGNEPCYIRLSHFWSRRVACKGTGCNANATAALDHTARLAQGSQSCFVGANTIPRALKAPLPCACDPDWVPTEGEGGAGFQDHTCWVTRPKNGSDRAQSAGCVGLSGSALAGKTDARGCVDADAAFLGSVTAGGLPTALRKSLLGFRPKEVCFCSRTGCNRSPACAAADGAAEGCQGEVPVAPLNASTRAPRKDQAKSGDGSALQGDYDYDSDGAAVAGLSFAAAVLLAL